MSEGVVACACEPGLGWLDAGQAICGSHHRPSIARPCQPCKAANMHSTLPCGAGGVGPLARPTPAPWGRSSVWRDMAPLVRPLASQMSCGMLQRRTCCRRRCCCCSAAALRLQPNASAASSAPHAATLCHPPRLHPSTLAPDVTVPPQTIHARVAHCTGTQASRPALQLLLVPPHSGLPGLGNASPRPFPARTCTHKDDALNEHPAVGMADWLPSDPRVAMRSLQHPLPLSPCPRRMCTLARRVRCATRQRRAHLHAVCPTVTLLSSCSGILSHTPTRCTRCA